MEYHDSDPERRNLVLISFAFLVYFIGDGEFKSGDINFQIVNLHLNNQVGLAVIAWAMLLWFFYRFMLKHSSTFLTLFRSELGEFLHRRYIRKFVEKSLKESLLPQIKFPTNTNEEEDGWLIHSIRHHRGKYFIHTQHVENLKRQPKTGEVETSRQKSSERGDIVSKPIFFEGFSGYFTFFRLFCDYCLTRPNFSTNLFPALMFLAASLTGIYKLWLN